MDKTLPKRLSVFLGALVLSGCATVTDLTGSMFVPYPVQADDYKRELLMGNGQQAVTTLKERNNQADQALYSLEYARIAQLSGQTDSSIEGFNTLFDLVAEKDEEAHITATGVAAQAGSLLVNDNIIPYEPATFEKVFAHQFQAMNFLQQGNVDSALVEVRRANFLQHEALTANEDEVVEAIEEKEEENAEQQPEVSADKLLDSYGEMDEVAGKVKSGFQSAYTFYISAAIYEMTGQLNDAYIDYKKAYEIFPDNPYLQQDLLRLSKRLNRKDYRRYSKQFSSKANKLGKKEGEVLVLFEHGFIPAKEEIKLPIPIADNIYNIAFPIYRGAWSEPTPLEIRANNKTLSSAAITYPRALAVKTLKDEAAELAVRQALRVYAKYKIQEEAGVAALAHVYNFVSERADLRSWLTLPNDVQIIRLPLPEGQHTLSLTHGQAKADTPITVKAGKLSIVRVAATDNWLIADNIYQQ